MEVRERSQNNPFRRKADSDRESKAVDTREEKE